MALSNSAMPPPYRRKLVVAAIRAAVRLSVESGYLSLSEFRQLTEAAIYAELRARGHTQHEIAVLARCSPNTVRRLAKTHRSLGAPEKKKRTHFVLDVIQALEAAASEGRSIAWMDLQAEFPEGGEWDPDRVTLRLFEKQGLIHISGDGPAAKIRLSPAWEKRKNRPWGRPIAQVEITLAFSRAIAEHLARGPLSLKDIHKIGQQEGLHPSEMNRSLHQLLEIGFIRKRAGERGQEGTYEVNEVAMRFIPKDREEKVRVGLLELFEHLSDFLSATLSGEEGLPVGQRNLHFDATPGDLAAFIQDHYRTAKAAIEKMNAAAKGRGDRLRTVMIWALAPIEGWGSKGAEGDVDPR